jgi:hypothetical protein
VNRYPQHIVANVLGTERAKAANLLNAGKGVNWSGWKSGGVPGMRWQPAGKRAGCQGPLPLTPW